MSPRKLLQRHFPERHEIGNHKLLRFFGKRLHDSELWHLHRRSVANGFSLGLFLAFIPAPIQMILAGVTAIAFRVNLPAALFAVWLTNPLTMGPIFFFAYRFGAWLLSEPIIVTDLELSFSWLMDTMGQIWQPFLLGCLVLGTLSAIIGNIAVRLMWRLQLVHRIKERQTRKQKTNADDHAKP